MTMEQPRGRRPGRAARQAEEPLDAGGSGSGFTLVELLAVLVIISVVGGLGAGAFQLARRNYELQASGSRLEGIIRAGRNAAVQSGSPARVVIDTARSEAAAYGFETVGEWGFEGEEDGVVSGARGAPATLRGGAALGKGHTGRGLHLTGGGYADCGAAPAYDFRAGVFAEAWVRWSKSSPGGQIMGGGTTTRTKAKTTRPRPAPKGRHLEARAVGVDDAAALLSKGSSFFLGIGGDGSLEGRIGEHRVRTAPGVMAAGRWTKVALWFDGEELLLQADGIERETYQPDHPGDEKSAARTPASIPPSGEPFLIGSTTLEADIDEVRLHGMVEPLRYQLGPRERFIGWKKVIRFDRRGRLDPRYHEMGVRVLLCAEEDRSEEPVRTEAAIDTTVTFEEWARRRGLAPGTVSEATEEARLLQKFAGARQVVISIDPSGALR
jgi:prepilin-type N-terminal cleavage/methylation domain-containing protein